MTPLKWFAGGRERRCEVMTIIDNLLEGINNTPQFAPLFSQALDRRFSRAHRFSRQRGALSREFACHMRRAGELYLKVPAEQAFH